jgi:hypothetical protein
VFGRLRNLSIIGWVSAVLYVFIAALFWTDAIFMHSRWVLRSTYLIIGLLTALYFIGIPLVRRARLRTVIGFAALLAVMGFIAGPIDSTDVFFYIAQGWEQSHYNGNPYSHVLRDIPNGLGDPMIASRWMALNRNPWLDEPLPYGFVFALITRILAWLGRGNWWLTYLFFNLLNLGVHAALSWLLWRTATLVPGADPKLVLYLYAWSPLIVLQFLANLHNDILMASLIVLAFYLLMRDKPLWSIPALVAAGFVKYVAFALAPFALIFLGRRFGWKTALKSLTLSALLAVVVSLPYIWELPSFKLGPVVTQFSESSGSLHAFVTFVYRAGASFVLRQQIDLHTFSQLAGTMCWLIAGMFTLRQLAKAWTSPSGPFEVASRWTSILFAVVFIGSSQFYPWYIGMLLPLSVIGAGTSLLTDVVVMLSGTHLVFTFLRTKAIGYFLISTVIPVALVVWRYRKRGHVICQ